jgi:hypothetical protein
MNRRRNNNRKAGNNAGPSRRDTTVHTRIVRDQQSLGINNVEGDFAFGVASFNLNLGNISQCGSIIESYAPFYEQYRIKRIVIRAQCGKGMTNDRRLQSIIVARVDVDNHDTSQVFSNFRSLANATNSKIKTLTERGNVPLVDFRPVMFDNNNNTTQATQPVLPNALQWYRIPDRQAHQWRGAVFGLAIPDPDLYPQQVKLTLMQEIHVEFRGRIQDRTTLTAFPPAIETLNVIPVTYDLVITEDELRTNILTGTWFPITMDYNVANVGTEVTGDAILDTVFRIQSSMTKYKVVHTDSGALSCNLVE